MFISTTRLLILSTALVLPAIGLATDDVQDKAPRTDQIDPYVDVLIKQVSDYLLLADSISVRSDVTFEEVLTTGQKIQMHRSGKLIARRPDRLRMELASDKGVKRFYYDGEKISLFDLSRNVFATIDKAGTIEEALDYAMDTYQVELPMADFLAGNLYENFINGTDSAFYAGLHYMEGEEYHHLALSNKNVDFQTWIKDDEAPLIHKVIITYKNLPGEPQYTAVFKDWQLNPIAPDMAFDFYPPVDAEQIEFLPVITGKGEK